jgi:cytochrome P460
MHLTLKHAGAFAGSVVLAVTIAVAADSSGATKPAAAPDKYSVKVPGGIALSECRGYDKWEVISLSHNGNKLALITGNPAMINAYKAGIPGNGKLWPDGARMAKIHWNPKQNTKAPGPPLVPDTLADVDCMVKDSKRFADSGGWGYGAFKFDKASQTFTPATTSDQPPQANDARCGFACHTIVKDRDYVFTEYAPR